MPHQVLALAPGRMFLTESRNRREVLNAPFRKFASDLATPARVAPSYIEEVWKYHHVKTMRLGFWVLERPAP
jgi:hypothetical protein